MATINITEACTNLNLPVIVHGSLFTAVCIIIVLAFLEKRKRKWLDCCDGRPGVVVPMNLLDDFENRWSYACSFGAMINVIPTLWSASDAFENVDDTYITVFMALLYSAEVCVVFFPFFACLLTSYKMVGAIIGALYSGSWFLVMFFMAVECALSELPAYLVIAMQGPALFCLVVVITRFCRLGYDLWQRKKYGIEKKDEKKVAEEFQLKFVKHVMNRHKEPPDETIEEGCCAKIKNFFHEYIWKKQPHFRFSSRIIATLVVAGIMNYQLALVTLISNIKLYQGVTENLANQTGEYNLTEVAMLTVNIISAGINITGIISIVVVTFDIVVILAKYRTNLIQLYQGDYSFIPSKYNASSAEIMRFCMVFPGYQIAYKLWGFALLLVTLSFIGIVISLLIVLLIQLDSLDVLKKIAAVIVIPGAASLALRFIQQGMSHLFFLQDKINADDDEKPLAVKNRRLYHITNYFFFIANIPIGLFSCLLRIGRSLIWSLLFLGRLDRCVLPPGFETQDKGFMSYIGMLLVEHTHNNPILRVFCQHLILATVKQPSTLPHGSGVTNINYAEHGDTEQSRGEMENYANYPGKFHMSKARLRRQLCYTLMNNPDLIAFRKQHLTEAIKVEKSKLVSRLIREGIEGALGVNDPGRGHNITPAIAPDVQVIIANQQRLKKQAAGKDKSDDSHNNSIHTHKDKMKDVYVNT